MLLETILLSFLISLFIRRCKFRNLSGITLRGSGLIFGGLLIRYLPALFNYPFLRAYTGELPILAPLFFILSFAFLAVGVSLNADRWPMILILAGVLLNFTVIALNAGFMPVSESALISAGYDISRISTQQLDMNHVLVTSQTRLSFLSDVFPIAKPFPQILSIGDFMMCFGLACFLIKSMITPKKVCRKYHGMQKNIYTKAELLQPDAPWNRRP